MYTKHDECGINYGNLLTCNMITLKVRYVQFLVLKTKSKTNTHTKMCLTTKQTNILVT